MELVTVNCEWDIGQEGIAFENHRLAVEWVKEALVDCGIEDTLEELEAEGLVNYDTLVVVTE